MPPERAVLDAADGLAALARLLALAEGLDEAACHGLGVLCALLGRQLEQAGDQMVDALIEPQRAA